MVLLLPCRHIQCVDVLVPYHYEGDPGLGPWVSEQRRSFFEDRLSQERIKKLESLGFNMAVESGSGEDQAKVGSPRENSVSLVAKWQANYQSLQKFYEKHGHCIVSRNQDKPLSYWVVRQRQLNFQNKLKPDRKELLDQVNFEWYVGNERPEHYFDEMIGRLLDYQQEYGCVDVPYHYFRGGLGEWVDGLKQQAREGLLEPDQADRLLRVGFTWLEDRDGWMKNLREVSDEVKGFRRDSHERLEFSQDVENWLRTQFMLVEYDLLPPKRKACLKSLGLTWNGEELAWVEHSEGDVMVGNAWLVDELATGMDLMDAALSWTPNKSKSSQQQHQQPTPIGKDDSSDSQTPPKNIVEDAQSPASSFGDDAQDVPTPSKKGAVQTSSTKRLSIQPSSEMDVETEGEPALKKLKVEASC